MLFWLIKVLGVGIMPTSASGIYCVITSVPLVFVIATGTTLHCCLTTVFWLCFDFNNVGQLTRAASEMCPVSLSLPLAFLSI